VAGTVDSGGGEQTTDPVGLRLLVDRANYEDYVVVPAGLGLKGA
jgi:hypothetical protein